MRKVIITGANGGIGRALCKLFHEKGYYVIGIDKNDPHLIPNTDLSLDIDIGKLSSSSKYNKKCLEDLSSNLDGLFLLINNAAVQILNDTLNISLEEWEETFSVNLTAPMILSQWAIPFLEKNNGSIINISSIHQSLTKPRFVSYATSKSALVGLTKAMAVDLRGRVRVNSISPAAIETAMLREGFNYDESALDVLRNLHPVQRIGYPEEVAQLAYFLAQDESGFINGANLTLDGGISSVLHDI